MGVTTVAFRKCIIDSQRYGRQESREVCRVVFDLEIDENSYKNVYVEVREGVRPGTHERPLKFSEIYGYEGPLNYEVLRGSIEFYFRQVMGGKESMMNSQDKFLKLTDWTFEQEMVVQFEMPEEEGYEKAY